MHRIIVSDNADSKDKHSVDTQAAASLSVGVNRLTLFIGTDIVAISNQRCVSALIQLRDAARQASFPVGPLNVNYVSMTPTDRSTISGVINANAYPVFTESDILISWGIIFNPGGASQVFIGHIDRLIETFQEQVLKLT